MTGAEQVVIGVQQTFWEALKAKDARLLAHVLADDFLALGRENQPKDEFITRLTSFPAEILALGGDGMQVHIFDDMAVLTVFQLAHMRLPNGHEVMESLVTTNVFRRDADQWRMVLAHPVASSKQD